MIDRLLTGLAGFAAGVTIGSLLIAAWGQQAPDPRMENIQLRKTLAQCMFNLATLEENALKATKHE